MSDHSFIREVIKEKPVDKKRLCMRFGMLVIAAVLFGGVAAVTFANVLPYIQKSMEFRRKPDKVAIVKEEDEPTPTPTQAPTPIPEEQQVTPEVVEVPVELGLEEYQKLYHDMKVASLDVQKSIVTVTGIKSVVDYSNNSYDNPAGKISGVIIANNGKELLILTEYRIMAEVDKIQVTFSNKKTVDAQYQKHDRNTNLTILKVSLDQLEKETMDEIMEAPLGNSYGLTQGEPVIALGSPMGYSDAIAFGMVTSVMNKVSTFDTEYPLVTTDILGSKTGSGVLINLEGEVVGVIAQDYSAENYAVAALSISPIKQLVESMSNNRPLPYLGIKGLDVTEEIENNYGIPRGVCIDSLQPDSPEVLEGLMSGDVIVRIGEEEVKTIAEYHKQLLTCTIGEKVKIAIMRHGADGYKEIVFDVTVQTL